MIYVTGDTHGNFERFQPEYFPEQAELTKNDIVIIAGDFGGVWFGDSRDDASLDWLESLPFTLAFVDGNHENFDALAVYPVEMWCGGKIQRIRPHVLHLMRGQIFELDGYRFFTMGVAMSHDIGCRTEHISWWRQELPSGEEYAEARQNLDRIGWEVNYIITHCAATGTIRGRKHYNRANQLTDFLREIREKARYDYWIFGHYHDNRMIDSTHILLWEQIVQII